MFKIFRRNFRAIFMLCGIGVALWGLPKAVASSHGKAPAHAAPSHSDPHAKPVDANHKADHKSAHTKVVAVSQGYFHKLGDLFGVLFHSFLKKCEELENLDIQNEYLREKLAAAESENEELKASLETYEEKKRAEHIIEEAKQEGGSPAARTIASLPELDMKLLSQPAAKLFEKALKAVEEHDFEMSANILYQLRSHKDVKALHQSRLYYLLGMSLFELGNFKNALEAFQTSKTHAEKAPLKDIQYASRSQAWMALCLSKMGRAEESKKFIKDLVHKYPHSIEAKKLRGGGRA